MPFINTAKDGSGSNYYQVGDTLGHTLVFEKWEPELQNDESVDDSDKEFEVPADEYWLVQWIYVELTTSADAGNRHLVVHILDAADDIIAQFRHGVVQAASTTRYYMFAPHVADLTAFRDTDYLSTTIPKMKLLSGWKVKIYDEAAIAAGADDMLVHMGIDKREVS